jgi:phosphonate transport system permease protein
MTSDAPLRAALLEHRPTVEARYGAALTGSSRGRLLGLSIGALATGIYVFGLVVLDISPLAIARGLNRLGDIALLMLPPSPGSWTRFWLYTSALSQTVAIALLGTLLAAVLAFPIGFIAAGNIVTNRVLHFLARRSLDTVRSVDTLIWALIWVNVVGLGPFAGLLAIASTDFAALGKLVSEAIETARRQPIDGVVAAGGSRLHAIRFGIVPQVLPIFLSQVLYFFESNTRSATIVGVVGGGGVGLYLYEEIRVLEWQQAAYLILIVLIAVAIIDAISRRLRGAIIGR